MDIKDIENEKYEQEQNGKILKKGIYIKLVKNKILLFQK
jgi:hypothetical protein